jgi:hypothetical protein
MCGFFGFGRARDKLRKVVSAKNMGIIIFKELQNYSELLLRTYHKTHRPVEKYGSSMKYREYRHMGVVLLV